MERWLPVVGWEGIYEVSDCGRVRSLDRVIAKRDRHGAVRQFNQAGKPLKPYEECAKGHYYRVALSPGPMYVRVHILVLEAFVGPRPRGLIACHNDGDHRNNHLANLRWDTYSANNLDLVKHGTHWQARKTCCKNGHEFTPANTIIRNQHGHRRCRECLRVAMHRWYVKRRAHTA